MPYRVDCFGHALRYLHTVNACSRFTATSAGRMEGENMQCVASNQLSGGIQYVTRGTESRWWHDTDSMAID